MAYSYKKYTQSQEVAKAQEALNKQEREKPGAYRSPWEAQLESTLAQILDRKPFQYDMNGDALYSQYRDQYTRQGKLAMEDALGRSAALTGGYGNSYAQQVGQQTYQGYLGQLNDRIPELYRLALSKYQQEGQALQGRYDLLSQRENTDYSRYQDAFSAWQTEREYLAGRYDAQRKEDYDRYTGERDLDFRLWQDAARKAQTQADALLALGVRPSDQLLHQADLTQEYVNGLLASLAAQTQAQTQAAVVRGKKTASKEEESGMTLAQKYAAMQAGGAPQRQLDKLLKDAIGSTVAGQYITNSIATQIRNNRF